MQLVEERGPRHLLRRGLRVVGDDQPAGRGALDAVSPLRLRRRRHLGRRVGALGVRRLCRSSLRGRGGRLGRHPPGAVRSAPGHRVPAHHVGELVGQQPASAAEGRGDYPGGEDHVAAEREGAGTGSASGGIRRGAGMEADGAEVVVEARLEEPAQLGRERTAGADHPEPGLDLRGRGVARGVARGFARRRRRAGARPPRRTRRRDAAPCRGPPRKHPDPPRTRRTGGPDRSRRMSAARRPARPRRRWEKGPRPRRLTLRLREPTESDPPPGRPRAPAGRRPGRSPACAEGSGRSRAPWSRGSRAPRRGGAGLAAAPRSRATNGPGPAPKPGGERVRRRKCAP